MNAIERREMSLLNGGTICGAWPYAEPFNLTPEQMERFIALGFCDEWR